MVQYVAQITKRQVLEAAARGEGCLGKAASDEPVFILRAQDIHSAELVQKWIIWATAGGAGEEKTECAKMVLDAMEAWPNKKRPD